jgi:hypothetical protein
MDLRNLTELVGCSHQLIDALNDSSAVSLSVRTPVTTQLKMTLAIHLPV